MKNTNPSTQPQSTISNKMSVEFQRFRKIYYLQIPIAIIYLWSYQCNSRQDEEYVDHFFKVIRDGKLNEKIMRELKKLGVESNYFEELLVQINDVEGYEDLRNVVASLSDTIIEDLIKSLEEDCPF
ncbi:hypothetical protein [Neobacillus sp. D3-1R]|uniref:hypothetical protein n=1 Tax=Neobacillus sp. D3-1R TaxID=3445778 RepID=UPI003F9EF85C